MSKKQHERFFLERFLNTAALAVEIVEERETPDFLIRHEQKLIGVEITELFVDECSVGGTLQAQESITARIVNRAQALYREAGGSPAHVSVCFSTAYDLRPLHRDRVASMLSSFVLDLGLTLWQRVDWRPDTLTSLLPPQISFIHALGVPSHDMGHWSVARAGWASPLTDNKLNERIGEKAKRLPQYSAIADETWLLLVADRSRPSQLFSRSETLNACTIRSPFSRTFYFGYPERDIVEFGT